MPIRGVCESDLVLAYTEEKQRQRYKYLKEEKKEFILSKQLPLSLLKDTDYFDKKAFESIYEDADEIGKILFSIIKTVRKDN